MADDPHAVARAEVDLKVAAETVVDRLRRGEGGGDPEDIRPGAVIDFVRAAVIDEGVVSGVAVDRVASGLAIDRVVAVPAVNGIVAGTAIEPVVPVVARIVSVPSRP
jgi:hypothetical protein